MLFVLSGRSGRMDVIFGGNYLYLYSMDCSNEHGMLELDMLIFVGH